MLPPQGMMTTTTPRGLTPQGLTPQAVVGGGGTPMARGLTGSEEERKAKLQKVVELLGHRQSLISCEGVERCAKRVGLDTEFEQDTLSVAGRALLVDIEFYAGEERVKSVGLSFPGHEQGEGGNTKKKEKWEKDLKRGADVLEKGLKKGWGTSVQAFAENLESLARMEGLRAGGCSAFDAVEGVREVLEKIWEKEVTRMGDGREVLCKGSGRPRVHADGKLGLALQYWMERRLVRETRRRKAEEMMEIDGKEDEDENDEEADGKIYAAIIECEASSSELYPSIRISDSWVSDAVERPAEILPEIDGALNLPTRTDWQDPPPTLITPDPPRSSDAMNLDPEPSSLPKPPDIRFAVKFEPPIIVPLQTALNIYESVSAPLPQDSIQATSYESMLLPPPSTSSEKSVLPNDSPNSMTKIQNAPPQHSSDLQSDRKYQYTLFATPSYAHAIDVLPFVHPRQLIDILPVLRQWVLVASLLCRCFDDSSSIIHNNIKTPNDDHNSSDSSDDGDYDDDDDDEEDDDDNDDGFSADDLLSSLLHRQRRSKSKLKPLAIDVNLSLSATEAPRFVVVFERGGRRVTVGFCVQLNGEIGNVDVDFPGAGEDNHGGDAQREERKRKVKKVLEVAEDLGVLVRWMGGGGSGDGV